jgi:ethanolamine ammonia-lyase small subunit
MPTVPQLAFQLAHAQARDAVYHPLDVGKCKASLCENLAVPAEHCLTLHSAASDRNVYLKRPDLGRKLDQTSRETLIRYGQTVSGSKENARPYDVAFVLADGLSALAIEINVVPFLKLACPHLVEQGYCIAPFTIVEQGRVAIGDEIGALLGAKLVVVLIGERPGLSSPDSMGLYITWNPKVGLTDESRNCISNIRREGLSFEEAERKLNFLITEAHTRRLTGVQLKDETVVESGRFSNQKRSFLLD